MKKILLLTGKDNITFCGILNTDINCEEADFYNNSRFVKIFRRNKLLVKYAFADWKKHILDYDIIILNYLSDFFKEIYKCHSILH